MSLAGILMSNMSNAASPSHLVPNPLWKQVDQAIDDGKPQTAVSLLERIIAAVEKEGAAVEKTRAVARKAYLKRQIEGNNPLETVSELATHLNSGNAGSEAILHCLIARNYLDYFRQNRMRILDRGPLEGDLEKSDPATWDLKRIYREIDEHFTQSLQGAAILRTIPIESWSFFLAPGALPSSYQPTLFDFVVHEAADFYLSNEQAGVRPEGFNDPDPGAPLLGNRASFLHWIPNENRTEPWIKACVLFQSCLTFHRDTGNQTALLATDLYRIQAMQRVLGNQVQGDQLTKAYLALMEESQGLEVHTLIAAGLAETYQTLGRLKEAHEVASHAIGLFPDSYGALLCKETRQEIEQPYFEMATEENWCKDGAEMMIRHKNVSQVEFKIFEYPWKDSDSVPEISYDRIKQTLNTIEPVLNWTKRLSDAKRFEQEEIIENLKFNLPNGHYLLAGAAESVYEGFGDYLGYCGFWVSNLSIVFEAESDSLKGWVLDASGGNPIQGAIVQLQIRQGNRSAVPQTAELTSDEDGVFRFPVDDRAITYDWSVRWNDDYLEGKNRFHQYFRQGFNRNESTFFFTDRALYRPGQTVRFKGLCLFDDKRSETYGVIEKRRLKIAFLDANAQQTSTLDITSNALGSFSGQFQIPDGVLTGSFQIQVLDGPPGSQSIRVEAYKRPRFEVKLATLKQAAKLGEDVRLTGKAETYSGLPVQGAGVQFTVVRKISLPWWKRFWFPDVLGGSQQLAHGEIQTDDSGEFEIEFNAAADPQLATHEDAIHYFEIQANVTDTAGETHSVARTIKLARQSFEIQSAIPDWLDQDTPFQIKVMTSNFDGEPIATSGGFSVYRIANPDALARPSYFKPKRSDALPSTLAPDSSWIREQEVHAGSFKTGADGSGTAELQLSEGFYEVEWTANEPDGGLVRSVSNFKVLNLQSIQCRLQDPFLVVVEKPVVEVDQIFRAIWVSGYPKARAHVEVVQKGKAIRSFWTEPDRTQQVLHFKVDESLRGGFTLKVMQVHQNRFMEHTSHVEVPWDNKNLQIKWEHWVADLEPGRTETWTAVIEAPDGRLNPTEMVATLYDASLDSHVRHGWPNIGSVFHRDWSYSMKFFSNQLNGLRPLDYWTYDRPSIEPPRYRFPAWVLSGSIGFEPRMMSRYGLAPNADLRMFKAEAASLAVADSYSTESAMLSAEADNGTSLATHAEPEFNLRRNLNETAFFYPDLTPDPDGKVRVQFKTPDSLTRWRFMGTAHDTALRNGLLETVSTTTLKLMVEPNLPRFVRQGDAILIPVRVTNHSDASLSGSAELKFQDAATGQNLTGILAEHADLIQAFNIEAGKSATLKWPIQIPDALHGLVVQASAATDELKDGLETVIPVLPSRVRVRESMPLFISGKGEKKYETKELAKVMENPAAKMEGITITAVANPIWEVVLSLPYLLEFPHECTEQLFARYYGNLIGRNLVARYPRLSILLNEWKKTGFLDGKLERNRELHSILLEETPWIQDALSESESRRNLLVLLDENRMTHELEKNLEKIERSQLPSGSWPWFPGGEPNLHITRYLVAGFGKVHQEGWIPFSPMMSRALDFLDEDALKIYEKHLKEHPNAPAPLRPDEVYSMFARSFFLTAKPIESAYQRAWDQLVDRANVSWLDLPIRSQGQLALALHRFGKSGQAKSIMESIREFAVRHEELGLSWRHPQQGWLWHQSPIETQADLLLAFEEILNDREVVELGKVWLLSQKRARHWPSTISTTDACMTLLNTGKEFESPGSSLTIHTGQSGSAIQLTADADNGFATRTFSMVPIAESIDQVVLNKNSDGIAWGGLHWSYWMDSNEVQQAHDGPLTIQKSIWVSEKTHQGEQLAPVSATVRPGDKVISRLVIRSDRDLDYVHVQDFRGCGLEPVSKLSQWHYRDGTSYYESIKDSATHLFIEHLPRGTFVLEIPLWLVHEGEYNSGHATIECMYAPEISSHSNGTKLVVGK